MDIKQVKTLLHLAASRLEGRNVEEDREIAGLLRQAERALDDAGVTTAGSSRVIALSPMDQALSWESRRMGEELSAGYLSEDVE